MKIKPIILSGGSGTRLWPISRKNNPKQFIDIFKKETNLFQETLNRVKNSIFDKPIIISNKEHRFDILKNIRAHRVKYDKLILEDSPKNTAPAFAVASNFCSLDQILCFLPSDHYIKNNNTFLSTIRRASNIAEKGNLVILGVKSSGPNENYGYITYKNIGENKSFYEVNKFIEKPKRRKAEKLFKEKAFWNSGIVIVKNSTLINLFKKYAMDLYLKCQLSAENSYKDNEFFFLEKKHWTKINSCSFDYKILEKNFRKLVVPLNIFWNDLGTYESLYESINTVGDVININTKNCFTYSNDKLLVTSGLNNLIIVNTKNATLVSKKGKSSDIRSIVKKLEATDREELLSEVSSNRPWGSFTNLGTGNGYKVKKLLIAPGQKISLQKHFKRSEHWVVVKGTALITKGKKSFILKTNQSTFIKKGEIHRIENRNKSDLIMIEVQTGNYLEEDDIKRLKDIYSR